ncbi:glycosyltransferase family 2 protein [Litoreibacter roseus]|uniref:Glycosyl transferase family 2 n=1 Tax=Litoreibacter roseus TaxID=2601869 RepID=A0A6N6JF51_9RHOB|nr:glycosyltransferase family 2 protein [Litoreibacter roseus]GFE64577.1 hypothetical protein KIN_16510 [Litoreibacter roseus]
MRTLKNYRLRLERKRWRARAFRKRRELSVAINRTGQIQSTDILLFSTIRNECLRLPYFLSYYRNLGVDHFFFVDNGSRDDTVEYLSGQPDVTLFQTDASYKLARFGVDWLNWLQMRYAHGHWSIVVDADEFLIYPFCDTRPLRALTDWLDASSIPSLSAMLLDMYAKGPLADVDYQPGQNPFEITEWFDSGNYTIEPNYKFGNLWIQGGPRARSFFLEDTYAAPALNKTPLVKWDRGYCYVSSTHSLLPRRLNHTYETGGGERISGCLLHAKFLNDFASKREEELQRRQHYGEGREYEAYEESTVDADGFWSPYSSRYTGWRDLETLGLISRGTWI